MKLRSSTKIAIGFAMVLAALFFGLKAYSSWAIDNETFTPIMPDRVNLVGISSSSYRIVVANDIAQLIQGKAQQFQSPGDDGGGSSEQKKRIPIREMLQSLQGNEEALGRFVMSMNDMKEDSIPPVRIYWTSEEIKKALAGDPVLQKKLIKDLNVDLDGSPIDSLNLSALQNGIVIKLPVPIQVAVAGEKKTLHGTVLQAYKPQLMKAVEARYQDKIEVTTQMMVGYYQEEAQKILDQPHKKENVRESLESMISDRKLEQYAEAPEEVLKSANVVVNNRLIVGARENTRMISGKAFTDMTINLTDEGRKRLWKYSKNRTGSQLLLIVNGVAIAAPVISHELAQSELTIKQLPDQVLVKQAVDEINDKEGDK